MSSTSQNRLKFFTVTKSTIETQIFFGSKAAPLETNASRFSRRSLFAGLKSSIVATNARPRCWSKIRTSYSYFSATPRTPLSLIRSRLGMENADCPFIIHYALLNVVRHFPSQMCRPSRPFIDGGDALTGGSRTPAKVVAAHSGLQSPQ